MKIRILLAAFFLIAGCGIVSAQTHSATLTCVPSVTPTVVGYNFYRRLTSATVLTKVNSSVIAACGYKDSSVTAGTTYIYTVRATDGVMESVDSAAVIAAIPANPPPPPTGPQVGNRIKVNSTANIRATAVNNGFGTLLGTEPTGALGTVTMTSTATIPGVPGATWIQVKFDSCSTTIPNCTGWMGSDNMTIVVTPPPPPPTLTSNGCAKTPSTFSCTWNFANMPADTTATVVGSAAGLTVPQTITVP